MSKKERDIDSKHSANLGVIVAEVGELLEYTPSEFVNDFAKEHNMFTLYGFLYSTQDKSIDPELYKYCSEQIDYMFEDLEKKGEICESDLKSVDIEIDLQILINKFFEKITPQQIHNYYLEAIKLLDTKSYNPEANKPYEKLTEEQREIDKYLVRKIKEVLGELIQEMIR